MNAFLQQLVQAYQQQAIDELAFRGYLSPRTLEELGQQRQSFLNESARNTPAQTGLNPAQPHPFARRTAALTTCCA